LQDDSAYPTARRRVDLLITGPDRMPDRVASARRLRRHASFAHPRIAPLASHRIFLLPLLLTLSAAAPMSGGAQAFPAAPGLGARPAAAAADSLTVARVQGDPLAALGRRVAVRGTVLRTSRSNDGAGVRMRFLLADERGDTVAATDPAELPVVGAEVVVTGMVELDGSGLPVIVPDGEFLSVQVLHAPEVAIPSATEPVPANADASSGCGGVPLLSAARVRCTVSSASPATLLAGTLALLLPLVGVGVVLRRRRAPDTDAGIALIIDLPTQAPPRATEPAVMLPAAGERPPMPSPPVAPSRPEPDAPRPASPPSSAPTGPEPTLPARDIIQEILSPDYPVYDPEGEQDVETDERVDTRRIPAVRIAGMPMQTPALSAAMDEGVVQLLPGRLETLQGDDLDPEIRFFCVSTTQVPEITFGREPGPEYTHVRLASSRVNRIHARMRYQNRQWVIQNLSRVSPVLVNGTAISVSEQGVPLAQGDTIQIGDSVFRFHERSF
jgi:hypothetical protein